MHLLRGPVGWSWWPGHCPPKLMLARKTAAMQCSCDFFIMEKQPVPHISNLLLIQEFSCCSSKWDSRGWEQTREYKCGAKRTHLSNCSAGFDSSFWESFLFSDFLFPCAGIFPVDQCLSRPSLFINLLIYLIFFFSTEGELKEIPYMWGKQMWQNREAPKVERLRENPTFPRLSKAFQPWPD